MPVRVITWNLYHGTIGGQQTPSDRLQQIAGIAAANNVDIVCLQEVPQAMLQPGFNGVATTNPPSMQALAAQTLGTFLTDFNVVQFYSEMSQQTPIDTQTSDGYLFLLRKAVITNWGNLQQFQPYNFTSPYGTFYRPPVSMQIQTGTGQGILMNWHCETGPGAGLCVDNLNNILGKASKQTYTTIIAGDFNVRGSVDNVSIGGSWQNWDDIVARFPIGTQGKKIWGLDHILTSRVAHPVLETILDFRSDAYHFPLAADVG